MEPIIHFFCFLGSIVDAFLNFVSWYPGWWLKAVKWVTGPITYMLFGLGTPYFNNPPDQVGTPNAILVIDVLIVYIWYLFSSLMGLLCWHRLVKGEPEDEMKQTWQYWLGFLGGVVIGPIVFMAIVSIGYFFADMLKGDKKYRRES
jgi:hypothetical protein